MVDLELVLDPKVDERATDELCPSPLTPRPASDPAGACAKRQPCQPRPTLHNSDSQGLAGALCHKIRCRLRP